VARWNNQGEEEKMTVEMIKRYRSIEVEPRWSYVLDILIANDVNIHRFGKLTGLCHTQLLHYIKGIHDPSQTTLRYICEGLERLTGIDRKKHSMILLWGEE